MIKLENAVPVLSFAYLLQVDQVVEDVRLHLAAARDKMGETAHSQLDHDKSHQPAFDMAR